MSSDSSSSSGEEPASNSRPPLESQFQSVTIEESNHVIQKDDVAIEKDYEGQQEEEESSSNIALL